MLCRGIGLSDGFMIETADEPDFWFEFFQILYPADFPEDEIFDLRGKTDGRFQEGTR